MPITTLERHERIANLQTIPTKPVMSGQLVVSRGFWMMAMVCAMNDDH